MTTVAPISADDTPDGTPLLLTADMLATQLQVSKRTLWRLRSAGLLPQPVRLGGTVRWRASDITAWIAAGCAAPRDARAKDQPTVE